MGRRKIEKVCGWCGKKFLTDSGNPKKIYCNRSCAAFARENAPRVTLTCEYCGKKFVRRVSKAYQHNSKRQYCSRKCCYADRRENPYKWQVDEYSPFRVYLGRAQQRHKGGYPRSRTVACTVTLQDLKEQWERQEGVCPYTGWGIILPPTTVHKKYGRHNIRMASLDRIDSSVGYIPGNIQWVCQIANYAKNDYADEELLEFCRAVTERHG